MPVSPAKLPELYAIVDAELTLARGYSIGEFTRSLAERGVTLMQYRDKRSDLDLLRRGMDEVEAALAPFACLRILNDHPELCAQRGWDGVHLGQGDATCADARQIVGAERWIGLSTHTREQVQAASATDADYLAIGPVFATGSKANPEPVVGLAGVSQARELTRKPLVAIGGITRSNAREVIAAGADSVAVIGALLALGVVRATGLEAGTSEARGILLLDSISE